jgi:molybdenum cofactor cytidylyltransferase
MAEHIPQGDRVAVLLMTHNYEADLEIMRGLRFHHLGYLGCLGPAKRYERLKKDMLDMHGEFISEHLQSVVSAPMGIFTNSNSPEAIALSTIAQIQEKLIERPKDHVWSVILAAGASKRFGSAKALAPWDGGTLLSRAIQSCQEVTDKSTLVVTGGYSDMVTAKIPNGTFHVYNPAWEQGMGSSIAWGVSAVLAKDPSAKFVVLLPVDQPFADAFHLKKLIQESQKTGRCVLTEGQGFMGPPSVIPQNLFEKALALKADQGLKKVLGASDITAVKNEVAAQDFDSPEELKSARML